ncbi:hypothetical protein [Kluyvera georgiana]|uniref:hypothetical protein n=1 Tax=Kluyvera georgiana TaxID=73098 RepID=UPI003AEF71C0
MKKIIIAITLLISGCGVAQQNKINYQLEQQKIQAIKDKPGMKAVEYLITDDKITKDEGGNSLCVNGCTFNYLVDAANKKPFTIVALYVGIHDYHGAAPSTYNIGDVATRRKTGGEILNNFSSAFGSSNLADKKHIDVLYGDFVRERSYIGLDKLDENDFKLQVEAIYSNRQEIVNQIAKIQNLNSEYVRQVETDELKKYEQENPSVRVNTEDKIPSGNEYGLIREAIGSMGFYKRRGQIEGVLKALPISESVMLTYVRSAVENCKRISAYSGSNIEAYCIKSVGNEMLLFAKMLNDPNTPQKTKSAAYSESLFGTYLDFGHAARLARMHNELCKQQGNDGYVAMVTVSVPCKAYKGAGIN